MPKSAVGAKPPRSKNIDWDGAWKEAIQQLFPAFVDLLFPEEHALIDWTIQPVFLEQELRHVTRRAKRGKRAVDKLARVQLLNGNETTLLVHMEFQHQVDSDLPARLYTYNTRIYSLLQEPVLTLVVLGDDDPRWRPAEFGYTIGRFVTKMVFPVTKLLDYEPQWLMLEQSSSPFAVIVMAHIKAQATMGLLESRLEWKLRLAKSLYARGYSESQIQQLVDFIDWLMVLDDKREERFDETMRLYEAEQSMETLSPYQKRFIAKGKQEGRQEGRQESLLDLLEARFDQVPEDIIAEVNRIESPIVIKNLLLEASRVATLDEFRNVLSS